MPDISMCMNETCKSKKQCYRYTATPTEGQQSYSGFKVEQGNERCASFISNTFGNDKKEL